MLREAGSGATAAPTVDVLQRLGFAVVGQPEGVGGEVAQGVGGGGHGATVPSGTDGPGHSDSRCQKPGRCISVQAYGQLRMNAEVPF